MRPSGAGLGNMSGQECTFSFMYTGQLPPGQVPLRTTSPRTSSPGKQASKKDNFPPDNFPPDMFPRTSSTSDKFPPGGTCPGGSCPGGSCLLAGQEPWQSDRVLPKFSFTVFCVDKKVRMFNFCFCHRQRRHFLLP